MSVKWQTLVDDERGCMKLELNSDYGVFLHLNLKAWNTDTLRSLRDGMAVLKGVLKLFDVDRIQVVIPEGDEKLYRFEKMFGFDEVYRKDGHILMRQGC